MSASSQQFWTNCFLLGVVSVSPVSPVSLAAKGSGVVAVFFWCLWFVCLCFLVALVWFFWCFLFPSLPACLSSFTDWCLVHKQQSREQKKNLAPRQYPEVNLGASSPYLGEMMMTDEKLFQNVDVCINVQTCETNSMKTCGLRFIEVWKNHM